MQDLEWKNLEVNELTNRYIKEFGKKKKASDEDVLNWCYGICHEFSFEDAAPDWQAEELYDRLEFLKIPLIKKEIFVNILMGEDYE